MFLRVQGVFSNVSTGPRCTARQAKYPPWKHSPSGPRRNIPDVSTGARTLDPAKHFLMIPEFWECFYGGEVGPPWKHSRMFLRGPTERMFLRVQGAGPRRNISANRPPWKHSLSHGVNVSTGGTWAPSKHFLFLRGAGALRIRRKTEMFLRRRDGPPAKHSWAAAVETF